MKLALKVFLVLILAALAYGAYYASRVLPILSGYGAKDLCSCVWVAGRQPQDVISKELGSFPLTLGSFTVDFHDSSASASVLGMVSRKAIYRKGLGCTLIAGTTESEVRAQHFKVPVHFSENSDTLAWPAGDRTSEAIPSSVDLEKLNSTIDKAFKEPNEKKLRNLRAVVVVYNGQIVAEKYAEGFNARSRHHGWSMTKSITNALVGIMVKNSAMRVDDPSPVSEWKSDARGKITLSDLLHSSSGLRWTENYSTTSEATDMLFKKQNMGAYVISQPLDNEPGKIFKYSSGTPNLISLLLRQSLGEPNYHAFPHDSLFAPIGMRSAVIEPDASGTFVGSSYSFATARDWARFGILYLNDGVWNGKRILPEDWVHYTTTPAPGATMGEYGALFWLNSGATGNPANRRYPDAPTDVFGCDGYEGQNIWILPSKKLVIVRLSQEHGNYLDENRFIADITSAIRN